MTDFGIPNPSEPQLLAALRWHGLARVTTETSMTDEDHYDYEIAGHQPEPVDIDNYERRIKSLEATLDKANAECNKLTAQRDKLLARAVYAHAVWRSYLERQVGPPPSAVKATNDLRDAIREITNPAIREIEAVEKT